MSYIARTCRYNEKIYKYTPSKIYIDKAIYELRVEKNKENGYNELETQVFMDSHLKR